MVFRRLAMLRRVIPFVLSVLAVAVAACAPAVSVTPPAARPPAAVEATSPLALPPLTAAPERWWMLDPASDGVAGAAVDRAYRELLAGREPVRTVIVAIIDSGVDTAHVDLRPVLWVNPGEVAGTGRDDDGNGYVDDVRGWNFIGGADGRNVDDDTYEVTRLYAACAARPGGVREGSPGAAALAARADCAAIERAFHAKREETEQLFAQLREMDAAVEMFWDILRRHLGEEPTAANVRTISSLRDDVRQARHAFLTLAEHDVTPELIRNDLGRLERLLEYGLDPAFDPRPIVGDDYADVSERIYGNRDVTGPDASHGTGVAGIVGAVRDNGSPVDGIAPAVRIMSVRAVPNGDERDKDVANAIRYAVDNGAHIINMSFGKGYSPEKAVVDAAVRYADERGVLLVHAAGNDGHDLGIEPSFPSRFYLDGDTARHWLEVGASSWRGGEQLAAEFSNYGDRHVHIFAPGVSILSTSPDGGYEAASGTSFAAPVVTGLAALLLSYFPELAAADVKRIILESATPLGERTVLLPGGEDARVRFAELSATGGIVNAFEAVRLAQQLVAQRR
jgi:subtilisin family serine protease